MEQLKEALKHKKKEKSPDKNNLNPELYQYAEDLLRERALIW
jgi:hypothetical protein